MTSHAITRAQERYGLTLNDCDLHEIAHRCKTKDAAVGRLNSDGFMVYLLVYQGVTIRPVIAPVGTIVTFLEAKRAWIARKNRRLKRSTIATIEPPRRVKKLSPRDCMEAD